MLSLKIKGKEYPAELSLETIKSYIYTKDVKVVEVQDFLAGLTTKQFLEVLLEAIIIGCLKTNREVDITTDDILNAQRLGHIDLDNLMKELSPEALLEEESEQGSKDQGK